MAAADRLFDALDTDGDGVITKDELAAGLRGRPEAESPFANQHRTASSRNVIDSVPAVRTAARPSLTRSNSEGAPLAEFQKLLQEWVVTEVDARTAALRTELEAQREWIGDRTIQLAKAIKGRTARADVADQIERAVATTERRMGSVAAAANAELLAAMKRCVDIITRTPHYQSFTVSGTGYNVSHRPGTAATRWRRTRRRRTRPRP
jgi:hypothetical protein